MAFIGPLEQVMKQSTNYPGFAEAYAYLLLVFQEGSEENRRLRSHKADAFVTIPLSETIFALEQVYFTKERQACFFESHRRYIDIQFILEGKERMDYCATKMLMVDLAYDVKKDFIKYHDLNHMTSFLLQKGDMAIFFPDDAHMPCLKTDNTTLVYKTVVKVPVC